MEWYNISEIPPPAGIEIMLELYGCKTCDYLIDQIREGEGLGCYKRWRFLNEKEKKIFKESRDKNS